MGPTQPFRFLDLPTELRLEVYRFAFTNSTTTFPRHPADETGKETTIHTTAAGTKTDGFPGILCVSKKIQLEAKPVFWETTHIAATEVEMLAKALEKLDLKQRASIERATISYIMDTRLPVKLRRDMADNVLKHWATYGASDEFGFDGSKIVYDAWLGIDGVKVEPQEKLWPREVGKDEDEELEFNLWRLDAIFDLYF